MEGVVAIAGAMVGRWWFLPVGTVIWGALYFVAVDERGPDVFGFAVGYGTAVAAVGVGVGKGARLAWRWMDPG